MLFLPAGPSQTTLLAPAFSSRQSLLCTRLRFVFSARIVLFESSAAIFPLLLISCVLLMLSSCPFSIHLSQHPMTAMIADISIPAMTILCPCGAGLSIPMPHRRKKLIPVICNISLFLMFWSFPFVYQPLCAIIYLVFSFCCRPGN